MECLQDVEVESRDRNSGEPTAQWQRMRVEIGRESVMCLIVHTDGGSRRHGIGAIWPTLSGHSGVMWGAPVGTEIETPQQEILMDCACMVDA